MNNKLIMGISDMSDPSVSIVQNGKIAFSEIGYSRSRGTSKSVSHDELLGICQTIRFITF